MENQNTSTQQPVVPTQSPVPVPAPTSKPTQIPTAAPIVSSENPKPRDFTTLLLRIGLIFVFAWAAVYGYLNPFVYSHYMPDFVEIIMPKDIALRFFAGYELGLCIFLASGKKIFYSGLLSALTLAAITITNYADFAILFRNVAIFFSALALAASGWVQRNKSL